MHSGDDQNQPHDEPNQWLILTVAKDRKSWGFEGAHEAARCHVVREGESGLADHQVDGRTAALIVCGANVHNSQWASIAELAKTVFASPEARVGIWCHLEGFTRFPTQTEWKSRFWASNRIGHQFSGLNHKGARWYSSAGKNGHHLAIKQFARAVRTSATTGAPVTGLAVLGEAWRLASIGDRASALLAAITALNRAMPDPNRQALRDKVIHVFENARTLQRLTTNSDFSIEEPDALFAEITSNNKAIAGAAQTRINKLVSTAKAALGDAVEAGSK